MPDPRIGPDQLEARLRHDLGEAPPELAGALHALAVRPLPEHRPAHLARVLDAVRAAQDQAAMTDLQPARRLPAGSSASLLAAIRSQIPVVGLPFWLGCAAVIVLGVLAGSLWLDPVVSPLLLTAPPLAALGVGYAFRAIDTGMAELERACPAHPVELALARLLLVVGFDLVLALLLLPWNAGTPLVSGGDVGLILDWLAPLLLSSGVSLLCTQRYGVLAGTSAGLGLWGVYLGLHLLVDQGVLALSVLQGLVVWFLLLAIGLVCLALALRQVGRLVLPETL
jgi:hypothetical protein